MAFAAVGGGLAAGSWGGDRLRLVVDDQGATVSTDCASGRIAGPIELGADGRFSAKGSFVEHRGGPQPADSNPASDAARFSGQVEGDTMRLSIVVGGSKSPLEFTLRRGASVKLVRCL